MKTNCHKLILALFAASLLPVAGAEPDADQLLRQMSAKLAAAKSFTFAATREMDPGLIEGSNAAGKVRVAVSVQRPNKITAQAKTKRGTRHLFFDGNTFSLLDAKPNYYTSVPMRTNIDGLVERLDKQFGFVPPLAEFALSDLYADLRRQAHTITYLGRGKTKEGFLGLGGVECHRIGLVGNNADAELWLSVNDHLPRKLVATFKNRPEQPQVRIAFSSWDLDAPAANFTFVPPQGAQKIEMWTTADMESAH